MFQDVTGIERHAKILIFAHMSGAVASAVAVDMAVAVRNLRIHVRLRHVVACILDEGPNTTKLGRVALENLAHGRVLHEQRGLHFAAKEVEKADEPRRGCEPSSSILVPKTLEHLTDLLLVADGP